MVNRPPAYLSCDVDTVDRHLQGYGFEDVPPCDCVYRTAVPRVLDLLDELGLPCTFFFIARDAREQAPLLREMLARGHEVASHSWSHIQPFSVLDDAALTYELEASRAVLSDVTGEDCVGFRAPAWDVNDRVFRALHAAGYRYDASLFPTPLLLMSRASVFLRSRGKLDVLSMNVLRHAFAQVTPHDIAVPGGGALREIPVTVSPCTRLPYYHTFGYMVPRPLFSAIYADVRRAAIPVSYEFHAADLLDLQADGVDLRLSRHPGMNLSLAGKRGFLEDSLARLKRDFDVQALREALAG